MPNKHKLSFAFDVVVMTKISFKDKIRSMMGMSSLKKAKWSLHCDEATEKGSTIDNNGIRCDKVIKKKSTVDDNGVECDKTREKDLIVDNDSVRCDKAMKKGSTVDNNSVRFTGLGKSSLEKIGSSLHYERHSRYCWGTSKGSSACFWIESSILLWWHCIMFFFKTFFLFFIRILR